jgi:hypothetical protein
MKRLPLTSRPRMQVVNPCFGRISLHGRSKTSRERVELELLRNEMLQRNLRISIGKHHVRDGDGVVTGTLAIRSSCSPKRETSPWGGGLLALLGTWLKSAGFLRSRF